MATALTAPIVGDYTSGDITLSPGTTIAFSITGSSPNVAMEIRKKDSQGAYWIISELVFPGNVNKSITQNSQRVITINNSTATAMTLQVYKPPTLVASGVDQD